MMAMGSLGVKQSSRASASYRRVYGRKVSAVDGRKRTHAPVHVPASNLHERHLRGSMTCVQASAEPSQEAASKASADAKGKGNYGELYEVTLPKPIGLSFGRGNDGMTYVSGISAQKGNIDSRIKVGDKVVKVSASFGADVWDALNYGQVVYAIRTRNGDLYFQFMSRNGDMSCFQPLEDDDTTAMFKNERAGGNYGIGTKELQQRNYIAKKESARKRRELFDDGLDKFQSGDYEGALLDWENVLGMEPKQYVSDTFQRVTSIYQTTAYNIACCYGKMNQVEAGLSALEDALRAGFEDYGKVRKDPNLSVLRESDKFKPMLNKYDEPIINEEAINAIKNLFSFGKKD